MFNVLTKGGTNDWHGSLFEYIQNTALEARNYFAEAESSLALERIRRQRWRPGPQEQVSFNFTFQNNPSVTQSPTFYTFPTEAMREGNSREVISPPSTIRAKRPR